MTSRTLALAAILAPIVFSAELPVREVILYKHGVGFFGRSGELKPGETARLEFKAGDMDDVLKSLTITDRAGGKISGIRYDASESLNRRLGDFPFALGQQSTLAAFLDQLKGAELEVKLGPETVSGTIAGARVANPPDHSQTAPHETVTLLTGAGELRTIDLGAAGSVRLTDPKLQTLFRNYLAVLNNARSQDKRSVYINSSGAGAGELVASYLTPAAVWKSSYRLLFGGAAGPLLEGWAIVDNTTGEDWTNVKLSVVSGRPISFITQLYEPKYVQRPTAELPEDRAAAPQVFQGGITSAAQAPALAKSLAPARPSAGPVSGNGLVGGIAGYALKKDAEADALRESSIAAAAMGEDTGELFEYNFAAPVTVKTGESAMLPFLQQRLAARKLLIYTDSMGLHPMNAAELSNSTGKTLDGGPITVYDQGSYAGEAMVETLKAGDKRLIGYGVDLGTRISTAWDGSRQVVREIHSRRGVLTTRTAIDETKTYTIKNVDPQAKTLMIEYPERPGYKLLNQTPAEKTSAAYRFEVKLAAARAETFPIQEERVTDQTVTLSSATPDVLATWIQNKALSDAGRQQLAGIARKKAEIASTGSALNQVKTGETSLEQDQERVRQNIRSLNAVAGQQDLVQQYARELAAAESKLAGLRDRESELLKQQAQLQAELNSLIENAEF